MEYHFIGPPDVSCLETLCPKRGWKAFLQPHGNKDPAARKAVPTIVCSGCKKVFHAHCWKNQFKEVCPACPTGEEGCRTRAKRARRG